MDDSKILTAMRNGVATSFPVKIRKFEIKLRPLSIVEETDIESEVVDLLMAMPENKRTRLMETRLLAAKSLERASTSDVDEKDYKLTQHELDRMTVDEIQSLWKQYTLGVQKINPSLETMSHEELLRLSAEVKKNPSALIELSSSVILSLAHLALTLEDKPQDN